MKSLEQMRADRAALDAQIKAAEVEARNAALKEAADNFRKLGISHEAVIAYFKRAGTAGKKVPPRYRHKATGQTWSGRGKTPAWYADARSQDEIEKLY